MAQTPSTEDLYEGDGVRTIFPLTFPYLSADEVFVAVDDVNTPYVWVGGSTASVQLAVAPVLGAEVKVYRNTKAFVPLHVFAGGVPFLPRYIDENNRQLLYVSQEAINSTAGTAAEALLVAEEAREIAQSAEDKVDAAIIDSAAKLRADLADGTDPAFGVALIAGVGRVAPTVAALRALTAPGPNSTFVVGYYAALDGGGGQYYRDTVDTTTADNGGTVLVSADGSRWKLAHTERATSKTFGCKGDKVTDDTVRLQAYINWCASFALWQPLVIDGICRVTASLMVSRPVDTTLSEWRVIGANAASGFIQNTAINLFESSTAMPGVDPVCEAITYENIRFEGGVSAGGAYILTRKFLRIKFLNCYFYKIRLLASDTYIQSFYFTDCNIRFWPGIWLVASHAFDTHFTHCQSEFGSGYLTNFANGSYTLTFTDGLHEGSAGGLVSGGGFQQLKVDGYYLEHNATADIALSAGATNYGVTVSNCLFAATPANVANTNFYSVDLGPTVGATGGGNRHTNGRLFDNSGLAAGGLLRNAAGDTAALAVFKTPTKADGASGTFTITNTLGTGTQNYAKWSRRGDLMRISVSYTFVGASGSQVCFIGLPLPAVESLISGFVNYTDYTATAVRVCGGTGFTVTAAADRFAPIQDLAGLGITYTALQGKTMVFEMTYKVA